MIRDLLLATALVAAALAPDAAALQNGFTVRPGWPVTLTGSSVDGGMLVDLDDDPELELVQVVGSNATGTRVHAFNPDATPVPGWPVDLDPDRGTFSAPAFGDIDGDGLMEVVVCTFYFGQSGNLWALERDGSTLAGFPLYVGGTRKGPALADLTRDGVMEIVVVTNVSGVGQVNVFEGDGSVVPGWPQILDDFSNTAAAVGDLDDDGTPEVVAVSYQTLYAFRADGTALPGFPQQFYGQVYNYNTPTLVDIDGDGDREIVLASCGQWVAGGEVRVLQHDGSVMAGWPRSLSHRTYTPPAVADIDGDGSLDIAIGDQTLSPFPTNSVYAWDRFGTLLPGFPIRPVEPVFTQIVVADIDGDSQAELVFDGNSAKSPLMAYNHDGTPVSGWPMAVQGSSFQQMPSVGDIDGDGLLDLAGSGNLLSAGNTVLTLWTSTFAWDEDLAQLPTFQYGPQRSGVADGDASAPIFCTSKPSSLPSCTPSLHGPGPTLSKGAGPGSYHIVASPVPGGSGRPGILIYTRSGLLGSPAGTSFGDLCLSQFLRAGAFPAFPGGTSKSCDGSYRWDFGKIAAVTPQIAVSDALHLQAWYRDPGNPGTANLTEGIGPITVLP